MLSSTAPRAESFTQLSRFPATRYQGSKLKLLAWIARSLEHLAFDTCLDLFSGTASVAYLFKAMGKRVTTNDYLEFNRVVAEALVVNSRDRLDNAQARSCFEREPNRSYQSFIADRFRGLFFLPEENEQLDVAAQNLARWPAGFDRSLALFSLYQACLKKRPYNLFHRANLYMRTAEVRRGFGNKATWDAPLVDHFQQALVGANQAVFDTGLEHRAYCGDCLEVEGSHDLVYLDPPYLGARGAGVDYLDFYHFLEGLTEYERWPSKVTTRYKHCPYARRDNPWQSRKRFLSALDAVLERYRAAIVVLSYRSDGYPTIEELAAALRRHGRRDAREHHRDHQYVLSKRKGREVLLISEPAALRTEGARGR